MGTRIVDEYGINVSRFYGGQDRGTCYQITIENCYVQLTTEEYQCLVTEMFLNLLFGRRSHG